MPLKVEHEYNKCPYNCGFRAKDITDINDHLIGHHQKDYESQKECSLAITLIRTEKPMKLVQNEHPCLIWMQCGCCIKLMNQHDMLHFEEHFKENRKPYFKWPHLALDRYISSPIKRTGGKLVRAVNYVNGKFRSPGDEHTDLYELMKDYVEEVLANYIEYWTWYDDIDDLPEKYMKVYSYATNDDVDVYVGSTRQQVSYRWSSSDVQAADILRDGNFIDTIFGFINEHEMKNENLKSELKKLFEDVFIHIFSKMVHVRCRNKQIPKTLWC